MENNIQKISATNIINGSTKGNEDLKKLAFANLNVCLNKGMEASPELARNCLSISALKLNIGTDEAYLVPFKTKNKATNQYEEKLQIQIGYKGILQLAYRSGQYKELGVSPVKSCDSVKRNGFTGQIEVLFETNYLRSTKAKIMGYLGYFKLNTGLVQTLFMSCDEIKAHASKYSKTYKFGVWNTNFDVMAQKTVIKLLINRKGVKSVELINALKIDQAVVNETIQPNKLVNETVLDYVDNPRRDLPSKEEKQLVVEVDKVEQTTNDWNV